MTAKEKAMEIVDKMESDYQYFASREIAIKHALFAVDEIIRVLQDEQDWYWEEVKREIEKL